MAIQKVGVIGCGLMGSGIAQVSAQAGFTTVVREVSQNALEKGIGSIHKFLQAGIDKGKVPPYELDKVKKNLTGTVKLEDLADCDLIVEAAPENLGLKKELYGALEGIVKPGAIFASNSPFAASSARCSGDSRRSRSRSRSDSEVVALPHAPSASAGSMSVTRSTASIWSTVSGSGIPASTLMAKASEISGLPETLSTASRPAAW